MTTRLLSALLALSLSFAAFSEPEKTPIKFGAIVGLSGGAAFMSENCRDGILMARDEINSSGGVLKQPLEIIFEDTGDLDLKRASLGAQKLINSDHVNALFSLWLEDTEVLAPIAEKAKIPFMATSCGGVNVGRFGKNVFRASNSDIVVTEAITKYLKEKNLHHACFVHSNTNYFENMVEAMKESTSKEGIELNTFMLNGYDFDPKSLIVRLSQSRCGVIIPFLLPTTLGPLVRTVRQSGNKSPIIGAPYYDFSAVGKELGDGAGDLIFIRYKLPDPKFREKYKAKYNRDEQYPAALCYDAIGVMSKVMNDHGTKYDDVNSGLRQISNYQGASGPFTIAANGDRFGQSVEFIRVNPTGNIKIVSN